MLRGVPDIVFNADKDKPPMLRCCTGGQRFQEHQHRNMYRMANMIFVP